MKTPICNFTVRHVRQRGARHKTPKDYSRKDKAWQREASNRLMLSAFYNLFNFHKAQNRPLAIFFGKQDVNGW
ncbi:hypothetical protein CCP4SC76_740002 [Gammaproteobacteria bacterium]